MLTHLTISNFMLVDQLDLTFHNGMTVVTGETGAGKSIMLDALGLTLGDRADSSLVTSERAEILSQFDVADIPEAKVWLESRELGSVQEEVILRRTISADGRSRAYINGVPCTLQDMKTLGGCLIDIHSQHEHQSLLKKETHRRLLDDYARQSDNTAKLGSLFRQYRDLSDTAEKLRNETRDNSDRLQLLSYQYTELQELGLQEDETVKLASEQKQLENAEVNVDYCTRAAELVGSEQEGSVINNLARTIQLLKEIDDSQLRPIVELLSGGLIQIEEASHDLARYAETYEINPERLVTVQDRLDKIYNIARKHRINPEDITELTTTLEQELAGMENRDEELDRLAQQLNEIKTKYIKLARKVSKGRTEAAVKLQSAVTDQLASLGMNGSRFAVNLTPAIDDELTATGLEGVEFLISTNPANEPRSLNKIASGGELSRISLAIQVVTANTSASPSLVFDEVDVGIGGATAEVVGHLLRQLGQTTQIVCVTHLAQVAAQGHQHFRVEKRKQAKQLLTQVVELSPAEKVEEIARMLGGIDVTTQSMAHAEEMYRTAQDS